MVKRYKFITSYKNYSLKVILPLGLTHAGPNSLPQGKISKLKGKENEEHAHKLLDTEVKVTWQIHGFSAQPEVLGFSSLYDELKDFTSQCEAKNGTKGSSSPASAPSSRPAKSPAVSKYSAAACHI